MFSYIRIEGHFEGNNKAIQFSDNNWNTRIVDIEDSPNNSSL